MLNLEYSLAAIVSPLVVVHCGIATIESRGMETSSTRERSAETCSTIVVSERMLSATVPPIVPFLPARESDPSSSSVSARPSAGSCACAAAVGRGPSSGSRSRWWMLSSSRTTNVSAAVPVNVTAASAVSATTRSARRSRRPRACLLVGAAGWAVSGTRPTLRACGRRRGDSCDGTVEGS